MPANQSTPEVTRAWEAVVTEFGAYMRDDWNGDYPEKLAMDAAVKALSSATPARGGDELREAITQAIARADAGFGYAYRMTKMDETGEEHTLFMDGFEPAVFEDREDGYPVIEQRRNTLRAGIAALASTDMAGASVPDRLARRMGAEFIARDDVPQVEGLTSGEGLRALSDRATAGPWAWEQCGDKEDAPVVGIAFPGDDPDCKAPYEGEFRDSDASRMTIAYDWQWCDGNSPSANAAFAVACVNYVRAMLAASPKAAATASVREDCAAACDRIATGSVYIGESEEGRARHEGIIAGARNCAAAIRRLTDSGTAATIGGERA